MLVPLELEEGDQEPKYVGTSRGWKGEGLHSPPEGNRALPTPLFSPTETCV